MNKEKHIAYMESIDDIKLEVAILLEERRMLDATRLLRRSSVYPVTEMKDAIILAKKIYEEINGKPYPVLYRNNENEKTDICPYCGKGHIHGIGDGHRSAHCTDGCKEIITDDGTVLNKGHGYILRTKKNVNNAIHADPRSADR